MKWIRNYDELSRKKQLAVGLVNSLIGIVVIILMDSSLGVPLEQSLVNIVVIIVVCSVFMLCYGTLLKIKRERAARK